MAEYRMKPLHTWRSAVASKAGPKSPVTRHVLLTLGLHMNEKGGSCFPSVRTLEEETGLSRRSVIEHLKRAEDDGWLVIRRHGYGGQAWRRHEYEAQIPDDARRALAEAEAEAADGSEGGEPRSPRGQKGGHRRSPRRTKGGEPRTPPSPEGGEPDSPPSAEGGEPRSEGGERGSPEYSKRDVSPKLPPKKRAAFRDGGGAAAGSGDGQDRAIEQMQEALASRLAELPDREATRLCALAEGLITGDDITAWRDHTGSQVPWEHRARLFRLALASWAADPSRPLRSVLLVTILQQFDPFDLPSSSDRQRGGRDPSGPVGASEQTTAAAIRARESAEREQAARDAARVAEWEAAHPQEASALRRQSREDIESNPIYDSQPRALIDRVVDATYRKAVLARLGGGS